MDLLKQDFAICGLFQRQPPVENLRRSRVAPDEDNARLRQLFHDQPQHEVLRQSAEDIA